MHLVARPYRDAADLTRMRQLLVEGNRANLPASYMHPGVFDWATHMPPDEEERRRNLYLWEGVGDGQGEVVAWAFFFGHEGSFDLFVHPTWHGMPVHAAVMDEYVAWAEARGREAGLKHLWPFWAMEYDTILVRLMQARGFELMQIDPAAPLFERTLDTLPTIPMPQGFTVQGVGNEEAGKLRAWINHSAFRIQSAWESYWAKYAQFMASAVYEGERDLFVAAPDGRGASGCTLWFDEINKVGLFEPVATHPDFQGKGLGKVVMAEGLRRMKAAGMQRAILGFDPNNVAARALYTSMGFSASAYFVAARKEL